MNLDVKDRVALVTGEREPMDAAEREKLRRGDALPGAGRRSS
jgi:hypothetical protein